ncbi:hypothetical protein CTA2_3017 [Colletotrichum tanaceti]|uniref:Uncharacterized protein n=1 Tax=Colletotrichum tanaceti TaxID=1306861 RepID=A0A4U6X5W3_9PEZI|nr:hypothetical protein CTA2_3017 [Colletotrichum tanaceti]TKW50454.1 hypothetical protein CTA1_5739 [Colletotrichum tanaceti]
MAYFIGDGINQYLNAGSDIDAPGASGRKWHLDCGTTSEQIVTNIFADCEVDGERPFGITANAINKKYVNDVGCAVECQWSRALE